MEQPSSKLAGTAANLSSEVVQKTGQQVSVNHDACLSLLSMASVDNEPDDCSVRHLSIGVKSYVDPKTKIEEDDALMHTSKDTSQFLSEVVDSASNLQTLSFSLNRYYDSDLDCATVAPFFPQLAHLRALELREPLRSSGDLRCLRAVCISAWSCHDRWISPERNVPCSTGWFHLYSHLTGLTKLSYERCAETYILKGQESSEVPTEHL